MRSAGLVGEFLERLDLRDVMLVGNDTGGALAQLSMVQGDSLVVLASCDAFQNYPPGLSRNVLVLSAKLPPALFGLFMRQLRITPIDGCRSPSAG